MFKLDHERGQFMSTSRRRLTKKLAPNLRCQAWQASLRYSSSSRPAQTYYLDISFCNEQHFVPNFEPDVVDFVCESFSEDSRRTVWNQDVRALYVRSFCFRQHDLLPWTILRMTSTMAVSSTFATEFRWIMPGMVREEVGCIGEIFLAFYSNSALI